MTAAERIQARKVYCPRCDVDAGEPCIDMRFTHHWRPALKGHHAERIRNVRDIAAIEREVLRDV